MTKAKGVLGTIDCVEDERIAAWQRLQYGMFIHWGLYSKLGGVWNGDPVTDGYSEQIQGWASIPEDEYSKVAKIFTAEKFRPVEIVALAKAAGMKYIVMTSKHHDGFAMFKTSTTNYNIAQSTLYGKDALRELAEEAHRQGLKFGVYFSLVDWHQGHEFDHNNDNPIPQHLEEIIVTQLYELMGNYGEIAEVWFDMGSPSEAQSEKFAAIVRELQPMAAINSRIFNNKCDFAERVRLLAVGFASVMARGGNYLLNIGLRGDGSVVEFEAKVLQEIGSWLRRHPRAVLGARPTRFSGLPWGEVTANGESLYLHIIKWPSSQELTLPGLATPVLSVQQDGATEQLKWEHQGRDLVIQLPEKVADSTLPVIRVDLSRELRIIPQKIAPLDGNVCIVKPEHLYVGKNTRIITGAELMGGLIGPFTLDPQQIEEFTITLAQPAYATMDLEVDFKQAVIGPKGDIRPR